VSPQVCDNSRAEGVLIWQQCVDRRLDRCSVAQGPSAWPCGYQFTPIDTSQCLLCGTAVCRLPNISWRHMQLPPLLVLLTLFAFSSPPSVPHTFIVIGNHAPKSRHICVSSVTILFPHLHPGLGNGLFPWAFPTKTVHAFAVSTCVLHIQEATHRILTYVGYKPRSNPRHARHASPLMSTWNNRCSLCEGKDSQDLRFLQATQTVAWRHCC
jgi:hypothetical protein